MRLGFGLGFLGQRPARAIYLLPGGPVTPFTVTRAGTATALAANGITSDVYAANTPRYNGADRRLLIEGARTNLFLNSAAPVTQNVTVTAAAHTLSFRGTGSIARSGVSTGTLVGTGATDRVRVTFTPTAGTLTLTVTGTVTEAQIEVGAFASSYIPTAGAAVARAADVVTATLASLSAAQPCTILWRGMVPQPAPSTASQNVIQVDDGTDANRFFIRGNAGTSTYNVFRSLANVTTSALIGGMTAGTPFSVGMSIDAAGRAAASFNGGTAAAVTAGPTTGMVTLRIGNAVGGSQPMFGETGALMAFAGALSDAELAARVASFA